jgi:hypothetical protein
VITVTSDIDVVERDRIAIVDPFQLASPCWRVRVIPQLPLEVVVNYADQKRIQTIIDKEKIMGIRIVAEAQAPQRMFSRGVVANKQDYADVLNALPNMKAGQSIIVDMDPKAWEGIKKPETTFGFALRRMFESKGLGITAYQSAKMQVTIRKANPLDATKKRKKA